MRVLRALGMLAACGLLLVEPAFAQEAAKEAFDAAAELEELRYNLLWIAYSAIWFLVFGFALKPHKMGQQTAAELDDLKARLADLEGRESGV